MGRWQGLLSPRCSRGVRYNESKHYQQYLPPASLALLRSAFDDPKFVFELKQDGFRSIAYIDHRGCLLISRKGFTGDSSHSRVLWASSAGMVLDGEIVIVD